MPGYPTLGWCPAHGGRDTTCCELWKAHETELEGARHVHQALSDPEACVASCPVCSYYNLPVYQRPGVTADTIAVQAFQEAKARRLQDKLQRNAHREKLEAFEAERSQRQGKLF